ncbi:MAG: HAD family phosphatase [Bacteroidetes bacterium]|nr:HAD family phosphatase [Bacteroidota bacterium]
MQTIQQTNTIIFDLGAVLIDWNPRHLYRKIFDSEEKMEWFLANICTSDWNEEQDAGRPFADAVQTLSQNHPEFRNEIHAFWERWEEMLAGPIEGTVEIFNQLRQSGQYKILALTNWSAETFPIARKKYDFLDWFHGIVMSGEEKTRKPHAEFYKILLNRYSVKAENSLFIDDNLRNIEAARELGIPSIHFTGPEALKEELKKSGFL